MKKIISNQKKIVVLAMTVVMVLALASCGGSSAEKIGTLELKQKGIKSVITYYGEGNIATEQTSDTEINFKDAGLVDQKNIDEISAQIKELGKQYDNLKGVEHKLTVTKDGIKEHIKIKFKEIDFEKAKKVQGLLLNKDPKDGVDYNSSKKYLEKVGFKEVK